MALISIKFEGKALKKLVEAVENGIGGLFCPYQIVRVANAEAKAKVVAAQAEMDVASIKEGLKRLDELGDLVAINAEPLPPLIETAKKGDYIAFATATETDRAIQRTRNLVSIVRKAAEDASEIPDDQVSDRTIDPDWFARWRLGAEDVSSEQMQQLWARILAGEVRGPGEFSLRTLDFLRSLSASEAGDIAKLAPFVIGNASFGDGCVVRDERTTPILDRADITVLTWIDLRDLGIIGELDGIVNTWQSERRDSFFVQIPCHDKVLIVTHDDGSRILKVWACLVTKVGRQLLSLARDVRADVEYFTAFGKIVEAMGFEVRLSDQHIAKPNWSRLTALFFSARHGLVSAHGGSSKEKSPSEANGPLRDSSLPTVTPNAAPESTPQVAAL